MELTLSSFVGAGQPNNERKERKRKGRKNKERKEKEQKQKQRKEKKRRLIDFLQCQTIRSKIDNNSILSTSS